MLYLFVRVVFGIRNKESCNIYAAVFMHAHIFEHNREASQPLWSEYSFSWRILSSKLVPTTCTSQSTWTHLHYKCSGQCPGLITRPQFGIHTGECVLSMLVLVVAIDRSLKGTKSKRFYIIKTFICMFVPSPNLGQFLSLISYMGLGLCSRSRGHWGYLVH